MIVLESDHALVEIDPAFGARVTSLWDKRARREWLITGPREGDASDTATYGGAQARGWDECFPTVLPCHHHAWGDLRDHGLLWGRPWTVEQDGRTACCTFSEERFTFRRTLTLHGATLHALYEVESHAEEPLPWMWSQHALLAARPGERIHLEGIRAVAAEGRPVPWPHYDGDDLSVVGAPEDKVARKLYASANGAVRATLKGSDVGIAVAWDDPAVSALGLWMDWGGWPDGAPVHQFALEPTTAAADDLLEAEARGEARLLSPSATAAWHMTITLLELS